MIANKSTFHGKGRVSIINIFFDTEFTGLHKNTILISIGCVAEDGRTFYAEFTDYDKSQCDDWINKNVIGNLHLNRYGCNEDWNKMEVYCDTAITEIYLAEWLRQFDLVQFVSDVCHYDFVLLIDLFGTAFNLPKNVCAACHDINQDIAKYYGISEREAFDKSREDILMDCIEFNGMSSVKGDKHNALYDAKVIREIYQILNNMDFNKER